MNKDTKEDRFTRRVLLIGGTASAVAGATLAAGDGAGNAVTGALPWQDGEGHVPESPPRIGPAFFSAAERAFMVAAADRMIPPDATGPSASEAGVVDFIDRQLAGSFGRGEHLFLGGPWFDGTESQGPQMRQAPAEFYRTAIAEIEQWVAREHGGRRFAALDGAAQDAQGCSTL
jgi:gluconate 2-dehydrogenase gamma chain